MALADFLDDDGVAEATYDALALRAEVGKNTARRVLQWAELHNVVGCWRRRRSASVMNLPNLWKFGVKTDWRDSC